MSDDKTIGQVAREAFYADMPDHRDESGGIVPQWHRAAAAVIAAHEAAKWRPMSEQDEVPTRALLAYECGGKRYVTACVIDWRYDDRQPELYISDDDSEPLFWPDAVTALAWQPLPVPPEVPR